MNHIVLRVEFIVRCLIIINVIIHVFIGQRNSVLQHKVQDHQSSGTLNLQENEIIQRIVQHDRDMAQCTQLIQTSAAHNLPAPSSATPVIWAPLVQAPLQAAAATTPLALALAHHSQLPPILFHHSLASGAASLKEALGQPMKGPIGATTPSSCGSGPSSPVSCPKFPSGLETPTPASLRTQHLSTGPLLPTVTSHPIFTSSLQPLAPLPTPLQHPPHSGIASAFPISQATVSYTCSAKLHSQPFHGAMTTPPHPFGLLQQGAPGRLAVRFPPPSVSTLNPLICSSVGPLLTHLQQSVHPTLQPVGSGHDRAGRTPSGPSFVNVPFSTSTQSTSRVIHPASTAGAAASLAQHSLAGLQSVFLPQVLPDHSALASLAQYGSADASPSYTPPLQSPRIQSPVKGRTVYHGEIPSTVGSQRSLTPQTSCPPKASCALSEGTETSGDLFTQEVKTISGSHSSLQQERPLAVCSFIERASGASSSFSSLVAVSKPYSPVPGQPTPVSRTHSGPEPQEQPGGVPSPHAQIIETKHKQSTLPSNLWGSDTPSTDGRTMRGSSSSWSLEVGGCVVI